jgi:isopenicillin N synthase-like dioxygenase
VHLNVKSQGLSEIVNEGHLPAAWTTGGAFPDFPVLPFCPCSNTQFGQSSRWRNPTAWVGACGGDGCGGQERETTAMPKHDRPIELVNGVIPILDVGPYLAGKPDALEEAARDLRYAFEKVGFYYMKGHGVPRDLIAAMYEQARRFHAQPLEKKLRLLIDKHNIGYMPMGGSTFRTSTVNRNTKPSVNEAFFLRRDRRPDDPDVVANKPLRGLNQWPLELPEFKETVLRYMAAMEDLGRRLVKVYAVALELPENFFDSMFQQPSVVQRLSHYPARPNFAENEFSIAPHTDSGFMTLLAPNAIPGLSIRLPDGAWFDAPALDDAYVVNGGDVLHRWTNERFLATPHRVIHSGETSRYAIPYFFDPHFDTLIECLPSCHSARSPAKFPPITYEQYAVWFALRNYDHQKFAAVPDRIDA